MEVISQPLLKALKYMKHDVLIVAQFYSDAIGVVNFMHLKWFRTEPVLVECTTNEYGMGEIT